MNWQPINTDQILIEVQPDGFLKVIYDPFWRIRKAILQHGVTFEQAVAAMLLLAAELKKSEEIN